MALRLFLLLTLLAVRMELPGCGPFIPATVFALQHQPERPEAEFARGRLGVVLPGYTRDYLFVAYRYLQGVGLTDSERQALFPAPPKPEESFKNPWLEARNQVPGVAPVNYVDATRVVQSPTAFEMYLNCYDDAFRSAGATLTRLSAKWGPSSANLKEWVAAQDQVFTNCAKGPAIPAAIPGDPERAYQVAAARFYAGQHTAAQQDFDAIAQDAASPWREIAPYLAARCLIRSGDYEGASKRLQQVIADPSRARYHESARGLQRYVEAKAHPIERLHELAGAVMRPDSATLERDLTDYHFLLDHHNDVKPEDDLTAWILDFQSNPKPGAVEKWRATHSNAWLLAAIAKVQAGDPAAAELIAAARALKPDSPAYATAQFHAARLLPAADARSVADDALRASLPVSAENLFRAVRMRTATDFDDFLRFAPRTGVGDDTYGELPIDARDQYLDADSAYVLSRLTPLRLLRRAAGSPALPEIARQNLRDVVYLRSVLLGATPANPDDVYRILRTPGLKPYADPGYGRFSKERDKIDNFRDNWWCATGQDEDGSWQFKVRTQLSPPLLLLGTPQAPFFSEEEQAEAHAEWEKLHNLPSGPSWLGEQTLTWAKTKPDDPRLAEALHLVVRATRYGCPDQDNRKYSRAAFDLLHRRFPSSEWAKKTPYWY